MIGELVGDWVIDAESGHDSRGRSFRAHAADDPTQLVTIKLFKSTREVHELFRGRLNLLRKLAHPNLVAYLGSGISHDEPYYVAEYVEGQDYESILRSGKRPEWAEVLAAGMQAVSALRHAHRRSVLHGDLKPANVIRLKDGSIKLAECGISRLFGADVPPPGDDLLASAAFISPEQAAGKTPTKRSDFYSLGCLLYVLFTGRPPFTAGSLVELIHKHCFVMPERPMHFVPDLPDEIDALVMKLLAKDPQVRPGSGTMLLAEFDRVWASLESRGRVGKRPVLATDDPMPVPSEEEKIAKPVRIVTPLAPPRKVMSRPGVVIPLFLLVVAAIIAGFYLTRTDPEDLWSRAQPLMRSDDPADWEKAWDDYLEPLSRSHPDRHTDEIKAFRARTKPVAELRRAQSSGKAAKYTSEAERFYQEGVKLCEAGDFAGARRNWERVVTAFSGIESESHWVELARQAAGKMPAQEGTLARPAALAALKGAIERAKILRRDGKDTEADAVLNALEILYRDDPDAAAIAAMIQKERAAK
jgi:serine/threonine protein kinase